jgi:hypothetical protein
MRCNAPTPDWRRIFFMEEAPLAANPPSLGSIEPHAGLLTLPPEGQLLYKIMTVENLLRSNGGSYLRFNRVDSSTGLSRRRPARRSAVARGSAQDP